MHFKRLQKIAYGLDQINIAPLVNIFFLLLIFFVLTLMLATKTGISVKLPKTLTTETIKNESLTIIITSENVMYLDGKIMTMKALRHILNKKQNREHAILIKADRRASLGRIIDIWNLSRELGIQKINIASNQLE